MKPYNLKYRRHRYSYLGLVELLMLGMMLHLIASNALSQQRDPTKGFHAASSYTLSDIENVNLTNGNLMLNIPLASLPGGRGTSPGYTVILNYNSKQWKATREYRNDGIGYGFEGLHYSRELVDWSEGSGWNLDMGGHQLKLVHRFDLEGEAPCTEGVGEDGYRRNGYAFKLTLQLPDGSVRELRVHGYSDYYDDGYFSIDPWGVVHGYSYSPPVPESEFPMCSSTHVQTASQGIIIIPWMARASDSFCRISPVLAYRR